MMICSRRLYKGNAYDICLPLADSGVTLARFYTRGDVILEKEPEISGDSMCFSFTEEDLASLEDGVLRYQVVTDYETTDTNSPYVVVTPGDYSGSTLEDLLEDAYNSGYTAGYESGYTDGQEECGHDYSRDYFTIEAMEDGQLNVYISCEYSINDGEWETFEEPATLSLSEGDKVRFRGYLEGADGMFSGNTIMSMVYGNIESLAYGDDFVGEDACISCSHMFNEYSGLTSAENLILPATTLVEGCYAGMFAGCTNLASAPELPATTLNNHSYQFMFAGCKSLATAPALPATTMAEYCYYCMFLDCSNLLEAPVLPSTTLAHSCYRAMFSRCGDLIKAPALPATTLATYCYDSMFNGCTSLTTAPELPAETLVNRCYAQIFQSCSSLNYVKCLATDLSASSCIIAWVKGVSTTGTFVKAPGVTWPTGTNGIPTGWTVEEA